MSFIHILECSLFFMIEKYILIIDFVKNPNTFKFNELMNTNNVEILKSIPKFIKKMFNAVRSS
jgi:hypothetical protein